jgi:putative heme-binding domain-containing protein
MQAKRELSTRPRDKVLPKLESWLTGLSSEDPEFEHHYLEALWLYDTMNTPNEKLLRKVLASPESRARASGVRILFHWRDHVDKPFELFAAAINDEHPQVRLEAVNMLREIGSLEAANIAIRALRRPVDQWLDYAIWLTARELRDAWLPALQSGKEVFGGATDQLRYALEATGDPRATERLVALLRDSKINENATPNVVKTIAALGNAPEVDYILTLADKQPSLLVSIAEGARHNAAKPDRATSVIEHITHGDRTVREAAAELAGIWRVTGADDVLASRVRNAQDASEHLIAARALARLKQFDRLAGLASSTQDQNVRIAAVAAWAEAQPEEARRPAVEILVSASQSEDIKPIFEAFINRASGASQLAEALEKFRLKEAIAITGIRLVRASGREFPELIVALNKAGALKPVAFDLTQHEREDLLTHVITSGDAKRGAEVYRRKSMACTLCHQIGTEGGKVGPELSSIGAYAQPAAILDSILSPNNDIKQGFETVIVTRKDDTTIAGVLQRRSDSATIIRDPANKIVEIPNVDVKKSAKSPVSLMPAGLTATLRNDELVDLIRYLTELDGNGDARPLHPQQK